MAQIDARLVGELKRITGLGMMECKRALVETNGDIKASEELLRVRTGIKATKLAGRVASQGCIAIQVSEDNKKAVMLEVNCETDFVAKEENFLNFINSIAKTILVNNISSGENALNKLNETTISDEGITIEEARKNIIAKLGENITIRRFEFIQTNNTLATYLHDKRFGVIVELSKGDTTLGKGIAMHIAAMKPLCVSEKDIDPALIERERSIFIQQETEASTGKPAELIEKIVNGKVKKYLSEITLLGQKYVKENDLSVEKFLANNNAEVARFVLYSLGEGIENQTVDFADEVAEIMSNNKK